MLEVPTDKRAQLRYYSALFRLSGMTDEFKDVLAVFAYTKKILQEANKDERVVIDIHQRQGALQFIDDFLNHVDNSRELVEKLEGKI